MQNIQNMQNMYQQPTQATSNLHPNAYDSPQWWWSFLGEMDELKLAGLVVFVTLVLAVVPVDRLIRDYLPNVFTKLPYTDILGRAILAGVMFYVLRALLL